MTSQLSSLESVGFESALSRRTMLRSAGISGGALLLGGFLGFQPAAHRVSADEGSGSILYGDLGSVDALIAAADLYRALDDVGSLDYATGIVSLDAGALKEVLGTYVDGDTFENAYQSYLRHAELGFAVDGDPEAVAMGRAISVPWSAVEYLVGDGQFTLPVEVQYAMLSDLGIMKAQSEQDIAATLAKRFANVPVELGGVAQSFTLRALPAMQENSWLSSLLKIILDIANGFKIDNTKVKRDILACIRTAMTRVFWWGMRMCFDADCSQTVIAYLRAGGNALTSAAVLGAVLALKIPFWVAAVIAGGLLVWGGTAKLLADAMQNALDRSGGRGACIDATWLLAFFGIPAVTASPNF